MRSQTNTVALFAIVVLLLANLAVLLSRGDSPTIPSAAWAQQRQGPIAGGAGLFVMPAQLSGNQWGCYLMDVDRGTLCVYQYQAGMSQLKLVAARNFTNDTKLSNMNTAPSPQEISDLVDKQNQALRGTRTGAGDTTKINTGEK